MSSMMMATDANNTNFAGAFNPDDALTVVFYRSAVKNEHMSNEHGRPIYDDVDYVKIITPGDQFTIIDQPVNEVHKARFPRQWNQFLQSGQSGYTMNGTPLSEWTQLSPAQVRMLNGYNFFTVENIAHASDQQINNIGMAGGMSAYALRDLAKAYLSRASENAADSRMVAALQERDDVIATMKGQLEMMQAQMREMQEKRPGRPRKETEEA